MRYLLALLLTVPILAQTTPTDGPPLSSAKQDYKHFGEFDFRFARMVRTKAVLLAPTNGSTCLNPYERVFAYQDGADHACVPSTFAGTQGTWATIGGSSGGGVEPSLFADLPVACSPGDLKYVTDATPPGIYGCPVTNTWAREKVSVHPDGSLVEDTLDGVTRHRVCPTCFLQTANAVGGGAYTPTTDGALAASKPLVSDSNGRITTGTSGGGYELPIALEFDNSGFGGTGDALSGPHDRYVNASDGSTTNVSWGSFLSPATMPATMTVSIPLGSAAAANNIRTQVWIYCKSLGSVDYDAAADIVLTNGAKNTAAHATAKRKILLTETIDTSTCPASTQIWFKAQLARGDGGDTNTGEVKIFGGNVTW